MGDKQVILKPEHC